jgi:GntR family transcriptional regulator, transcriptional repressor for pyruvate dehydrogenase complex
MRTAMPRADASQQVAQELRRYIGTNGLVPGDRLGTEHELAAELGVSRPTLREALRLLSGSHLLRSRQGPGGGIFVASTPGEGMGRNLSEAIATMLATESVSLHQLLDARRFLEVPLAGMAARHARADTIEALEAAVRDAEGEMPGTPAFDRADARFHQAIARAAGNELLVAFTSWILDVLQPSLIAHIGHAVDPEEILCQHRAILRAIRRGQPAAAERAMARHIGHLEDVVRALD